MHIISIHDPSVECWVYFFVLIRLSNIQGLILFLIQVAVQTILVVRVSCVDRLMQIPCDVYVPLVSSVLVHPVMVIITVFWLANKCVLVRVSQVLHVLSCPWYCTDTFIILSIQLFQWILTFSTWLLLNLTNHRTLYKWNIRISRPQWHYTLW